MVRFSSRPGLVRTGESGAILGRAGLLVGLIGLVFGAVVAIEWVGQGLRPAVQPVASIRDLQAAGRFPRRIKTIDGVVEIPARPRRIVSQVLAADEILLAICPLDRIAGIHSIALDANYSNCVAQARKIKDRAVVGGEAVIALDPDLVFLSSYSRADTVAQLRAGVDAAIVRLSHFDSLAEIKRNIRTIGFAIGRDEAAATLIAQMEARIEAALARVPKGDRRPRVVSFDQASLTAGAGTLLNDLLGLVGARNLAAENGIEGIGQIGVEQVASWNPDVIICGAQPGSTQTVRRRMLDNEVLAATRAGRKRRIVVIDNRRFLAVSQHVAGLVEDLVAGIYEEGARLAEPADEATTTRSNRR